MKPKGDNAMTSGAAVITVDVPGAFDGFLDGTSEVQGDNGETPFLLAYNAATRITRARGYTMRLRFPAADAKEVLWVLRMYAETCIDSNSGQMDEPGVRTEVTAARTVLDRCDKLMAELKARRVDSATGTSDTEPESQNAPAPGSEPVPVATAWYAEPHADGFRATNGTDYLTDHNGQPQVYETRDTAEWFANGATVRDRDRQSRATCWLTVLDGKEIRWFSTPAIRHSGDSVIRESRCLVSIVDPASDRPARLIDHDDVENPRRVVRLSGKPLGYTKFGRYTSQSFKRFSRAYPEHAHLVQGINEGRGITRQVHLNADGNDTEGLWK